MEKKFESGAKWFIVENSKDTELLHELKASKPNPSNNKERLKCYLEQASSFTLSPKQQKSWEQCCQEFQDYTVKNQIYFQSDLDTIPDEFFDDEVPIEVTNKVTNEVTNKVPIEVTNKVPNEMTNNELLISSIPDDFFDD